MITRHRQGIKNRGGNALGTSESHLFRLSATMVELSLGHNQLNSLPNIPASVPIKPECNSAEAKVQFSPNIAATIEQQENKAAQPHHSGLEAGREFSRLRISRISDYGVKLYWSLKSRMRFLAAGSAAILLTLLAFSVVYAVRRHHQDAVKSQSQIPAAVQQRDSAPVSSSASEPTHDDAHSAPPTKAKSRRRQGDYVAKDTYVYYGKDGKPSH